MEAWGHDSVAGLNCSSQNSFSWVFLQRGVTETPMGGLEGGSEAGVTLRVTHIARLWPLTSPPHHLVPSLCDSSLAALLYPLLPWLRLLGPVCALSSGDKASWLP